MTPQQLYEYITVLYKNLKLCCFSFLQPSWIAVDFDNWRDWEHEEDEGKEEFDRYADVSAHNVSNNEVT